MSRADARSEAMTFWNECLPDLNSDMGRSEKIAKLMERMRAKSFPQLFAIMFGLDDLAQAFRLLHSAIETSLYAQVEERSDEFLAMANEFADDDENQDIKDLMEMVGMLVKVANGLNARKRQPS